VVAVLARALQCRIYLTKFVFRRDVIRKMKELDTNSYMGHPLHLGDKDGSAGGGTCLVLEDHSP
jgi:hypothetical protein